MIYFLQKYFQAFFRKGKRLKNDFAGGLSVGFRRNIGLCHSSLHFSLSKKKVTRNEWVWCEKSVPLMVLYRNWKTKAFGNKSLVKECIFYVVTKINPRGFTLNFRNTPYFLYFFFVNICLCYFMFLTQKTIYVSMEERNPLLPNSFSQKP